MSVTTDPSVSNSQFKMTFQPGRTDYVDTSILTLPNLSQSITIPIAFDTITFVQTAEGVYTPANDTERPISFETLNIQPSWVLVYVDHFVNLQILRADNSFMLNTTPVSKLFFMTFTNMASLSSAKPKYLTFDGRTGLSQVFTMPQGTPVTWFVACGDGVVS